VEFEMVIFIAMCLFALSMSLSPGPVNLISLSSGLNFGVKKSLPFVSGASIGFTLLLLCVGLGVGTVVVNTPIFLDVLCIIGSSFIGYMGVKLASSKAELVFTEKKLPSFNQGFVLQWLNPKAWIACVAGVSAFNLINDFGQLLVFVSLYFVICFICIACWAVAGQKVSQYLTMPRYIRVFNLLMGGLLIAVALYLFLTQFEMISGF